MRLRIAAASLVLGALILTSAPSAERAAAVIRPGGKVARAHHPRPGCHRLFTVKMSERAADAVYQGTRKVTSRNLRMLTHIKACERNPAAKKFVYGYYQRQRKAWATRVAQKVYDLNHPWYTSPASEWDGSSPGCGFSSTYEVASRTWACGSQIEFNYHGNTVTAVVTDCGPAAWTGRDWDLGTGTADAIGFNGLDDVQWRPISGSEGPARC